MQQSPSFNEILQGTLVQKTHTKMSYSGWSPTLCPHASPSSGVPLRLLGPRPFPAMKANELRAVTDSVDGSHRHTPKGRGQTQKGGCEADGSFSLSSNTGRAEQRGRQWRAQRRPLRRSVPSGSTKETARGLMTSWPVVRTAASACFTVPAPRKASHYTLTISALPMSHFCDILIGNG